MLFTIKNSQKLTDLATIKGGGEKVEEKLNIENEEVDEVKKEELEVIIVKEEEPILEQTMIINDSPKKSKKKKIKANSTAKIKPKMSEERKKK